MHKPLNPDANPNEQDPVVREYNLLTNVFNRVLRTLCYTWQKDYDGVMPYGEVSEDIKNVCLYSVLKYEYIPHKSLCGFKKVFIKKGEKIIVKFDKE